MNHFVAEMCTFLLQNGAWKDMRPVHCGICATGHRGLVRHIYASVNDVCINNNGFNQISPIVCAVLSCFGWDVSRPSVQMLISLLYLTGGFYTISEQFGDWTAISRLQDFTRFYDKASELSNNETGPRWWNLTQHTFCYESDCMAQSFCGEMFLPLGIFGLAYFSYS